MLCKFFSFTKFFVKEIVSRLFHGNTEGEKTKLFVILQRKGDAQTYIIIPLFSRFITKMFFDRDACKKEQFLAVSQFVRDDHPQFELNHWPTVFASVLYSSLWQLRRDGQPCQGESLRMPHRICNTLPTVLAAVLRPFCKVQNQRTGLPSVQFQGNFSNPLEYHHQDDDPPHERG